MESRLSVKWRRSEGKEAYNSDLCPGSARNCLAVAAENMLIQIRNSANAFAAKPMVEERLQGVGSES